MKRWEDIDDEGRRLIEMTLRHQRKGALMIAMKVMAQLGESAAARDRLALKYSKDAEEALDAALERLGFSL